MLEETNARIEALSAKDAKANREVLTRLKNSTDILTKSIIRANGELLKYEGMRPIKKLAERQREAYRQSLKVSEVQDGGELRGADARTNETFHRGNEDIRYSVRDGRITADSSEAERYEILKDATVKLAKVNWERAEKFGGNLDRIRMTESVKVIKTIAATLGISDLSLHNSKLDMDFDFSLKNIGKSASHQKDYGGSYSDFARVLSSIEELAENAVPIEVHGDKKEGTKKANPNLKNVYVLVAALEDGDGYIPVQMEVKEFYDRDAGLYLNVALNKMESGVGDTRRLPDEQGGLTYLLPDSEISIAEIFKNVNPETDARFLKL